MSQTRGWNANFLQYELVVGSIATAAVILWSEVCNGRSDIEHFIDIHSGLLYTVVAPIDAVLLGFIIAAAAIIVTAASDKRMKLLRESAHYTDLWASFRSAMRFLGGGTVITVVGLVVAGHTAARLLFFIVLWASILAALRVARCVWALNWIIRVFTGPSMKRAAGA